ncbi:MAG: hypothetical protein LBC53_09410 [Spirochaetaceae bacterium]|jgi:hypothetical protein|nr:hypothetical protein [Spirochaetaceae bacterium]
MLGIEYENQFLPDEYKEKAAALFSPAGPHPSQKALMDFVDLLGISVEYKRVLSMDNDALDFTKFISSFYKNIELLIDKTWVEASEEMRKETLHARLPAFFSALEEKNYKKALNEFSCVLDELAFLLFGEQSRKKDFVEYTFRIDSQIGLFWWYTAALRNYRPDLKHEFQRALLLIGLCYLSNF